jgi:hypothetical protein
MRALVAVVVVVIAIGGFLLFRVISHDSVRLHTKVLGVRVAGDGGVIVSWQIDNTGLNPAYYKHCTISIVASNGDVLGSSSGGPYPPQLNVGPISNGDSWTTSTAVTTHGRSEGATHVDARCTQPVNAGK